MLKLLCLSLCVLGSTYAGDKSKYGKGMGDKSDDMSAATTLIPETLVPETLVPETLAPETEDMGSDKKDKMDAKKYPKKDPEEPDMEPKKGAGGPDPEESDGESPVPTVMEVWMINAKYIEDEDRMKSNACPGGAPAHSMCEEDKDCVYSFGCMEGFDDGYKYCCVMDEEVLAYVTCPGVSTPTANKWCTEDSDCGENAKCHNQFDVPKELVAAALKDQPGLEKEPHTGVCCSESMDTIPDGVATCPKGLTPFRRGPCGLTIPGCPLGSECLYHEDMFGRCCGPEDADAKLDESNFRGRGFRGGFRRGGFRGGFGRGFRGGFGRGFGFGGLRRPGFGFRPHFGGFGSHYHFARPIYRPGIRYHPFGFGRK